MTIDQATATFKIPDLYGALADYLINGDAVHVHGHSSHGDDAISPFDAVELWTKVQIQNCAYHEPHNIIPAQMANALPPSPTWPSSGCTDTVLIHQFRLCLASKWCKWYDTFNFNFCHVKLIPGLGHQVVQLCLIFCIANTLPTPKMNKFLLYVQPFDIIPQILSPLVNSEL
jgi:hypothetical protein